MYVILTQKHKTECGSHSENFEDDSQAQGDKQVCSVKKYIYSYITLSHIAV